MVERVYNFLLKEEELMVFKDMAAHSFRVSSITNLGNFNYVLSITESGMNKAIKDIDSKASALYIDSGGRYDTSIPASLVGAFRRTLTIGQ